MKKPLSVRHQRFCEFIAAGESQTDAYLNAGFKVPKADARKHAARLMTKDDIKARIATLRAPQTAKVLLSKERKREILHGLATNEKAAPLTRIRAIEVDAKLAGHFEPEKVEVDSGPITLQTIQSIAERVRIVSPLLLHKMVSAGKGQGHQAVENFEEKTKAENGPRPLSLLRP